jgi:ketosteroid isomerase-like protein
MSLLRPVSSVLIAAFALVGLVGTVVAAGPDAAVHAVDQSWMKAYNAGDAAAIANLYADNGCLFAPGHDVACGHAAILALMTDEAGEAKKAGLTIAFFPSSDDSSSGDTGWNSGRYTVTAGG